MLVELNEDDSITHLFKIEKSCQFILSKKNLFSIRNIFLKRILLTNALKIVIKKYF